MWHKLVSSFLLLFISLFIITVPFDYSILPNIGALFSSFFSSIAQWVGVEILGLPDSSLFLLLSDSTGLYVHVLVLFIASIVFSFVWGLRGSKEYSFLSIVLRISAYFLALQLLDYGFNKIFKLQFYSPEPNLLFTNLGQLSKDILYWSSMGTSYVYSVFMGGIEVIVAVLLLFRKTRFIASLAAFAVLLNVVAINFGFDISVKIYSLFLLFLSVVLLWIQRGRLADMLGNTLAKPINYSFPLPSLFKKIWLLPMLKSILVLLFLVEAIYPNVKSNNFNDDNYVYSKIQGAYLLDSNPSFTHLFIHRRGYFILQNQDGSMSSHRMKLDEINQEITMIMGDYSFLVKYKEEESKLRFTGKLLHHSLDLLAKPIDLSELPIKDDGFHWTID